MNPLLRDLVARAARFEREAHSILGQHESSSSRVVILDQSYDTLRQLNIRQDDLMRQALRCVEHELFRAAHVMAWSAFMDFYEEKLGSDDLVRVRAERPTWKRTKDMEELREYQTENSLIELAQPVGLATKNEMKALQGMLNKRNQCAHPSSFHPGLNDALGYISEALHYIRLISSREINAAPDARSSTR